MKGLLLKDLMLLSSQKKIMVMLVFIGIFISLSQPVVVISYLAFCGCMFATSTMTYDETNDGYSFLFTLPVSRRQYVQEKYLFLIVWTVLCVVLGCVLSVLIVQFGAGVLEEGIAFIPLYGIMMASAAFIMLSVMVPLRIRYGNEKGKLVLYVAAGFVTAVILVIGRLNLAFFSSAFRNIKTGTLCLILLGISLLLLVISEQISQKIIARMEY